MNTEMIISAGLDVVGHEYRAKVTNLSYRQLVTIRRWIDQEGMELSWYGHGGFFVFGCLPDAVAFLTRWYEECLSRSVPYAECRSGCPYLPT